VSSGVTALEAAAVVTEAAEVDAAGAAAAGDLGVASVILAGPDGVVR
jgi:hypothetical protein